MKKTIYHLLVLLLLSTKLPAQVCTLIDSFKINLPSVDTEHMQEAESIAYSNGYLWIAATSTYERDYNVDTIHLFKYDLTGHRIDSLPYHYLGDQIVNITADGTYIWAMRLSTDSLYKFDIATKSLVTAYGMGGRGTAEPGYSMASLGDTIYFMGGSGGKCFKFKKSTGVFYDHSNYVSHTGAYPSAMCAVGSNLVTTTYLTLVPVNFDNVSLAYPGSFTENISSRANWCIDVPSALTYGGGYFWQLKTIPLFFDIRTTCVYKVQSSLAALGVNDIANENDFVISPNPSNETINISYPAEQAWNTFTVSLFNMTGTNILEQQVSGENGKFSIGISRLNLCAGMYIIRLWNGGQQIMKKVSVY